MFNKLIRIAGNLTFALLLGLFGGYIFAAIICMALAWLLSFIGFTITATDIIRSTGGFMILLACFCFFAFLGYFVGETVQRGIERFFGGGEK